MKNLNFLSNQSDFGLENGSGMTREWLGIDSTVSRKLFTLLFVLLLGFGQMWGAKDDAVASVNPTADLGAGQNYDPASNDDWAVNVTNNSAFGTNAKSGNNAKLKLSNNSSVSTRNTAIATALAAYTEAEFTVNTQYVAALIGLTNLSNVGKVGVTYGGTNGGNPDDMWVLYSTNSGSTYSVAGHTSSVSSGTNITFTSTISSAQYAVVFKRSAAFGIKSNPTITFYEGATQPTCTAPSITAQPTGGNYNKNAAATLSVTASGTSLTYQWYSNTTNSTTGATIINGATSSSYSPSTATGGTKYYYCIVSSSTCTTTSNIVAVTVNVPVSSVSLNKNSTSIVENQTETLTATVSPNDATNKTVNWSTSDASVATVSGGVVTAKAVGTATITATSAADNSKSASCTVTVTAAPKDHFIDEVQGSSVADKTSAYDISTVKIADKTVATSGSCEQQHYHFVGWITKAKYDAGTAISNSDIQTGNKTPNNSTYYAVWAKQGAGGASSPTEYIMNSSGSLNTNWQDDQDRNNGIQSYAGKSSFQMYGETKTMNPCELTSQIRFTNITGISINVAANNANTVSLYYSADGSSWETWGNTVSVAKNTSSYTDYDFNLTNFPSGSYYICISNSTSSMYMYSVTITSGSAPTYTDYIAKCCTPLVSINGSFNVTSKSESARAFVWANETTVADVAHYELSYKVKGAQGDPTPIANNISNSTSTYTHTADLTAGETYVYYLKAVGANNHCDATEELEVVIPQITVTGTPIAEMTYAQGDGPSSAESFVVKGKGLTDNLSVEAPANFEVCLTNSATASDWKTSGTAITITKANAESNSGQTVYVRLKAGLLNANSPFGSSNVVVSGGSATSVNVSVSGTVSSSCTAPVVATPTLTSIANGTITVSCASITVDENCDVDEYGFVWKASSDPSITDNKNPIDGDYADNFSKTLTIGGFTTGTTYNIKAYGHNSADNGLSSTLAVTPQSVTFRVNSVAVSTVYVNSGSKVAAPVDPSQTGWDFQEWQSSGVAYDFDAAVTEDLVLDAFFTIQSFNLTWTTDGDALTGDYTGKSGKVNYGTTIVAPNTPTKTGYTFAAWSPAVAATMPDHDLSYTATWTAKQYAITLDREGATTGSESVTMTYNANTHTAITAPSKDGYIFGGWYAEDNGEGAQVMNASGTLQANVEGFTGANGIWTKDAICTLYAKWTPITFTVAYNANGGSGETMSNQDYTYDVPQTLSANTYTAPLHKYFYGWHSVKASADAGTREFTDAQTNVQNLTKTNGATVTLYAVWKDHTYTNYRTLCCNPLAAPANIAVSVTGAATATVTWDAVADATGYEYKLGNGDWTDTEIAGNAASPELSLTGLTGASDYTIYVRTNGNGDNCAEGTPSAGTNFKTHSTVTAAVNDALMGTAKVKLSDGDWSTSVEAADGTTIYLQATPGSLYEFSNWATPASGTISSNQLTGWSGDVTVTANFVAKELTKLDTPTGMGLVGEPTATSATIKWNAVDHASGYEVVCAGATKGDITVTDGVASCPLTILTAGTTYYWTVMALGDGISFEDGDACASQNFTTDLRKPTAIEITHAPTLTEYLEGQSFATAGMVVKVTYNNGDIDGAYTGYSIDPSGALTFGMTSVTVTATENGQSRSTTQAITVHKKYTLTFKNNGSIVETRDLKEGDAYGTFPSAGGACDATSTTFMGWSTVAEFSDKREAAPAEGYASEDDVMGTENVILNAVWAKVSGNDGADVNTVMWAENWNNATVSNGSSGQSSANPDDNCSTSKGTIIYNSAAISYTQSSSDYVYCRNDNSYAGGTVPELYIKSGYSWTISGIPTGNAATLTLTFKANTASFQTLTVSTTEVGKNPTISGSITEKVGTYTITTDGASTLQITFGNNSNTRIDDVVLKVATKNISYTDYLTTCCDEWSVTASYGESNTINVGDDALAVTLSDVAYGAASYESSDEAVLTVAADGKITGVKAGSATVTIAWAGIPGSKCAFETTVDVTVNGPITVTYNANDGSQDPETTSQNATSNSAFTLDANSFSRTGYTFQGWATTPSGDKAYNDSQADVEFVEDVTLYAVWAINSHAVTLNQPTGNTITANSSTTPGDVNYGTTVTLTATENETASDGYVFTGWTVDGATVVDASAKETTFTMPDNDVTVTATYSTYTWDFVNYTVAPTPGTVYTDADQFDKSAYTVTANYKRSDTEEPKAVDLETDDWTAKLNGTAIADNYEFAAGDDGKELAFYVDETMVWSGNITVTKVDKDRFIDGLWGETFTLKKGTYDMPTPQAHAAGSTDCQKHNTFAGWVLEANAENPTEDDLITGETATGVTAANNTYYAVWSKSENVMKEFTVSKSSFSETGSSSSVSINSDVRYSSQQNGGTHAPFISSSILRLYKPANNQNYGNSITITASTGTLKKVTIEVSSATYKYVKSTYTTSGLIDGTLTDGKIVLDNLSSTNLTIINVGGDKIDISKIEVLYEKEVTEVDYITDCDPRYDVEFSAGIGATGSYDKVTKKAGVEITLPDGTALSKEHHTFAGWYSAHYDVTYSESTSMAYTVPVDGETLVAQWTEDHHAFVHFMNGESEITGSPIKVYDGETFDLAAALVEAGKEFIGWKWNGSMYTGGQGSQHMDNPAEDRTYVAVWMPVIDVATIADANLSDGKWILVQNKSQLKAGDFIVIAAADYAKALSNNQKSNNRGDAEATKNLDTLNITSTVAPLFLQYDPESGYYALYDRAYDSNQDEVADASGYLFANGGSSNVLKTQTGITMQGLWAIDIVDKKASIVAQGNNSNRTMRYNSGSSLFTCYSGTNQQDIAIYKWAKNISSDMNVSDITNTDMVIVQDGKTLTINVPATLDNVIVEVGGKVNNTYNMTVNSLTIKSEAGKSGQVMDGEKVTANAVYMNVTFYKGATALNATTADRWYMISAPFDVNLSNGFFQTNGTPMVFGTDFDLFEYDGSKRATTGTTGWKRAQGKMKAGVACLIGFNADQPTTIRLKAASAVGEPTSIALQAFAGDDDNQNWNGVANPTLHYTDINKDVQTYNNEDGENGRKYIAYTAASTSFVVGTAFFVQETGSIDLSAATHHQFRAPKRAEANERYEACLRLFRQEATEFADQMYVRASESAMSEYEQGHDMITWNDATGKTAMIWAENYGMRLAIEEAPLVNDKASYELGIFAPAEGAYRIEANDTYDNAALYLTYNGKAIWNLSMSACELNLAKGLNEGYGLRLVAKMPQTPTGIESISDEGLEIRGAQKIVLEDKVFILRGGKMYDVTGKAVR